MLKSFKISKYINILMCKFLAGRFNVACKNCFLCFPFLEQYILDGVSHQGRGMASFHMDWLFVWNLKHMKFMYCYITCDQYSTRSTPLVDVIIIITLKAFLLLKHIWPRIFISNIELIFQSFAFHRLNIELGRYNNVLKENRICNICRRLNTTNVIVLTTRTKQSFNLRGIITKSLVEEMGS